MDVGEQPGASLISGGSASSVMTAKLTGTQQPCQLLSLSSEPPDLILSFSFHEGGNHVTQRSQGKALCPSQPQLRLGVEYGQMGRFRYKLKVLTVSCMG